MPIFVPKSLKPWLATFSQVVEAEDVSRIPDCNELGMFRMGSHVDILKARMI